VSDKSGKPLFHLVNPYKNLLQSIFCFDHFNKGAGWAGIVVKVRPEFGPFFLKAQPSHFLIALSYSGGARRPGNQVPNHLLLVS
jgi:hypothetical protein